MSAPRVIAHLDLDAFYSQVERKRLINDGFIDDDDDTDDAACCSTSGNKMMMKMRRAVCVAQYNPFEKGGVKTLTIDDRRILDCEDPATDSHSLIAVSYEARAMGIKRNMRVGEAKRRARVCGGTVDNEDDKGEWWIVVRGALFVCASTDETIKGGFDAV